MPALLKGTVGEHLQFLQRNGKKTADALDSVHSNVTVVEHWLRFHFICPTFVYYPLSIVLLHR